MNKIRFTTFLFSITIALALSAQTSQIENYLEKAGSHVTLFNGELETNYSVMFYENLPYYRGAEYRKGTLWTHQNVYPNQQMRLDLYKDLLISLAPETPFGIIIPSNMVKELMLDNTRFIYLPSGNKAGLNAGYYISIYRGSELNLVCREVFILNTPSDKIKGNFSVSRKYHLISSKGTTIVKNRKSFTKLFPQYKKKIKDYSKANKLNFSKKTNESMHQLASFIEQLLIQNNDL